ncbi:MAG: hypothetical protein ACU85V_14790 [Gammaproteobacteria bacterium]
MPVRNPGGYPDKSLEWTQRFLRRRAAELAPLVDDALLEEHRADPRGEQQRHSHALKQILDFIHNQPADGKSFAYAAKPNEEYRVGIMHERGREPTILDDVVYASEREAVHAVFLERLRRLGLLLAEDAVPGA